MSTKRSGKLENRRSRPGGPEKGPAQRTARRFQGQVQPEIKGKGEIYGFLTCGADYFLRTGCALSAQDQSGSFLQRSRTPWETAERERSAASPAGRDRIGACVGFPGPPGHALGWLRTAGRRRERVGSPVELAKKPSYPKGRRPFRKGQALSLAGTGLSPLGTSFALLGTTFAQAGKGAVPSGKSLVQQGRGVYPLGQSFIPLGTSF